MLKNRLVKSVAVFYALLAGTVAPALFYIGYQVADIEFLLTCAGLLVPALVLGGAAVVIPPLEQLLPTVLLVTYMHIYWPGVAGEAVSAGVAALLVGTAFWFAGPRLVSVVAVALLAGAAASFTETSPAVDQVISDARTKESSKPPVIHILLDEHASDWGLPDDIIPQQDRKLLWQPLVDRGFAVFDRSFSRSINTPQSLIRFFNPRSPVPDEFLRKIGTRWELATAQTLEQVAENRDLFLLVNSFIDPSPAVSHLPQVATLERWHVTNPMLTGINLPWDDRLEVAAATVFAWLAGQQEVPLFKWLYNDSSYKDALQQWFFARSHPQYASAVLMLDRLKTELADRGRRGRYYFTHLMLPHFPYVFDRACRIKPSSEWLSRNVILGPDTHATRAQRYRLHVDQALCLQSMLLPLIDRVLNDPNMADAVIILHSDHGSRISSTPGERWCAVGGTEEEYEHDWRASMLAVRVPGINGLRVRKPTDAVDVYRRLVEGDFSAAALWPVVDPAEPGIPAVAQLFVPLGPLSGLVGNGWHDAISYDGRWTGAQADARLAVPAGDAAHYLSLSITSGRVPTTVTVTLEGQAIAQRTLPPLQQFNLVKEVSG